MNTLIKRVGQLLLLSLTLSGGMPAIANDGYCRAVKSKIFSEYENLEGGMSDDSKVQYNLLAHCLQKSDYCVIAQDSLASKYVILNGSRNSKQISSSKLIAIAAVARFNHLPKSCMLARYSGGSAAAWALAAWRIDSKGLVRQINTQGAEIHGEGLLPAGLLSEMVSAEAALHEPSR